MRFLEEVTLTIEELEAIRLKDLEKLDQESSAKKMKISQPTFNRLLDSARKKVAEALVGGKALRIEGGNYEMVTNPIRMTRKFMCFDCKHVWELPYGTGIPENCPKCKSRNIHRHIADRGPQRKS
ncbi:MAG: DUF134 domain-containing protein [Candidatus Aenigmatarchaeota archaeon]